MITVILFACVAALSIPAMLAIVFNDPAMTNKYTLPCFFIVMGIGIFFVGLAIGEMIHLYEPVHLGQQ